MPSLRMRSGDIHISRSEEDLPINYLILFHKLKNLNIYLLIFVLSLLESVTFPNGKVTDFNRRNINFHVL